ncbi:MAG TPA: hypothetical protein VG842_10915, partial [Sediminibacterium sp.]|nr:hypothetical protein [Sediminibacterium sp.]
PLSHPNWPNYILGPAAMLLQNGYLQKGFNLALTSDIPIGAGLSSSAAVECATIFALDTLFSLRLERLSIAKMAQQAEHAFAGVRCGIMDQFASVMGKKDQVLKLDCRTLEYAYIPFRLEGIKLLLLNSNVKHSLGSSAYNTRRSECEMAVNWIKEFQPFVHTLRDVDMPMLKAYVQPKSDLIYRRAGFVVNEIRRLQEACMDIQQGDNQSLGQKMLETHEGLSTQYEVSCRELDWLIGFVKNKPSVIGARMMGGGFGGCTLNLVRKEYLDELVQTVTAAYAHAMGMPLSAYVVSIEDGTSLIN